MIADIVLILVVAAFVALGCRKGLVRSLVGLTSFIMSLVIAFFVYPIASALLLKTPVYTFVVNTVNKSSLMEQMESRSGKMYDVISKYLGDIDVSAINPAETVAELMISVLSFILVLIISRVIIWLIVKAINIIAKFPIMKQFNKLGGGIVGGFEGILILYIVFAVIITFVTFEEDNAVLSAIEESTLAKSMYKENVLLNVIDKGDSGI